MKLGFSDGAAKALIDQQLLADDDALLELDDDRVDDICRAVRKPGGGQDGHQIAELAIQRLKLAVFYMKHQVRCQRVGNLMITDNEDLDTLKQQYLLEKNWKVTNPDTDLKPMALEDNRAPIAFELAKTILRGRRGTTGIPLAYVVRHEIAPEDALYDPWWGHEDSTYLTIDQELIARAPILKKGPTSNREADETIGPFDPTFLADARLVWDILYALWGTTSAWQHVRKFEKTMNGRQAWRTLHNLFFGGNQVQIPFRIQEHGDLRPRKILDL